MQSCSFFLLTVFFWKKFFLVHIGWSECEILSNILWRDFSPCQHLLVRLPMGLLFCCCGHSIHLCIVMYEIEKVSFFFFFFFNVSNLNWDYLEFNNDHAMKYSQHVKRSWFWYIFCFFSPFTAWFMISPLPSSPNLHLGESDC